MDFFQFYSEFKRTFLKVNSGDPDQMSDLGLHCLTMYGHKKVARPYGLSLSGHF